MDRINNYIKRDMTSNMNVQSIGKFEGDYAGMGGEERLTAMTKEVFNDDLELQKLEGQAAGRMQKLIDGTGAANVQLQGQGESLNRVNETTNKIDDEAKAAANAIL